MALLNVTVGGTIYSRHGRLQKLFCSGTLNNSATISCNGGGVGNATGSTADYSSRLRGSFDLVLAAPGQTARLAVRGGVETEPRHSAKWNGRQWQEPAVQVGRTTAGSAGSTAGLARCFRSVPFLTPTSSYRRVIYGRRDQRKEQ